MYSPASEIQAYLAATVKKYSVDRYIKLSHEIKSCAWDASTAKWKVTVKDLEAERTFEDQADVLIMARGGLNHIAWPNIDGLKSFKGEVMHSADWNQEYVIPIPPHLYHPSQLSIFKTRSFTDMVSQTAMTSPQSASA